MKKNTVLEGINHKYKIVKSFKNGGNATIYEAINDSNELVAIKILHHIQTEKIERFINELRFQMSSKHINIVPILDFGYNKSNDTELPFYVMNVYEQNLRDILSEKSLEPSKIIKYYLQLCKAVSYAHKKRVVHRDIKPENVLYDKKHDRLLLADFGIAKFIDLKFTKDKEKLGNSDYRAPEQHKGSSDEAGPYTDVYSLGLLLNEMFTHNIPYGMNYTKIGDVSPTYGVLDQLVEEMLQHNVDSRLKDVNQVIDLITMYHNKIRNDINEIGETLLQNKPKEISIKEFRIAKMQIPQDISLANNLLNNPLTDWNDVETNYHYNYGYHTHDLTINLCIQLNILESIQSKFNNESYPYLREYKEKTLDLYDVRENEIFQKIYDKIHNYPTYKLFNYLEKRILKYTHSLKSYHALEFYESLDQTIKRVRDNLSDAPILWISYYLREAIDLLKQLDQRDEFHIEDHISINWNRFHKDILEDSKVSWRKKLNERIENDVFSSLYKRNIQFTHVRFKNGYNLIFKTKHQYSKFKKLMIELGENYPKSDIIHDDINHLLNIDFIYHSSTILYLDGFDFYTILPKLLDIETSIN